MNMQVAETTVTTPKKKVVSKKKAKTAKTKKASLKKTKVSKDTIKRRADGLRLLPRQPGALPGGRRTNRHTGPRALGFFPKQ